jgi:hypothetical protein
MCVHSLDRGKMCGAGSCYISLPRLLLSELLAVVVRVFSVGPGLQKGGCLCVATRRAHRAWATRLGEV